MLSSWLLLGRLFNVSKSNCAHNLDARLDLFWAEDWSALWTMERAECDVALAHNATRRTTNRNMHAYAQLPRLHFQVKMDEPWRQPGMHRLYRSQSRLFRRSRVSTRQIQNLPLQHRLWCQIFSCQRSQNSSLPLSAEGQDSANLDRLACRAEHWTLAHSQETTCLCRWLHTQQQQQFTTQCCNTSRLDRSHRSPNPQADTDRFSWCLFSADLHSDQLWQPRRNQLPNVLDHCSMELDDQMEQTR